MFDQNNVHADGKDRIYIDSDSDIDINVIEHMETLSNVITTCTDNEEKYTFFVATTLKSFRSGIFIMTIIIFILLIKM